MCAPKGYQIRLAGQRRETEFEKWGFFAFLTTCQSYACPTPNTQVCTYMCVCTKYSEIVFSQTLAS
jgi:hypothetical protein